jgi:hypothetical protein
MERTVRMVAVGRWIDVMRAIRAAMPRVVEA